MPNTLSPQDLIRAYPWLDEMVAETLIWAYENGTLDEKLKNWTEQKRKPVDMQEIVGAVVVSPPVENFPTPPITTTNDDSE